MRRSSTSASARDLQTSSASSRRFRWSSPRSRWASSCSRSCSGAGGFAATRTRIAATTTIRTNPRKNTIPPICRTAAPSQFSIRWSFPAMSGRAAATIPQKKSTTTTCSWCNSRVSNRSCREKKSMSFSITRNASPQNTARRTTLNQNSCARVVSPRRPETGPSFQAFSKKFRDGFVLGVGGGSAPRVSTTGRTYSPMRQPLSIDVQSPLYTHLEVTTQSPDGDPHPTHLGHPHSHFVPPSFAAKPELLVCSGIPLDGDSSGRFALGARRRPIGGRFSFGFVCVCIDHKPRRHALALLSRQHLEPADRRECPLPSPGHQEALGLRDDDRRRRPHPASERPGHEGVGE